MDLSFLFNRISNAFSDHTMAFIYSVVSISVLFYLVWDLNNFKKNQLSRQVSSRIGRISNGENDKEKIDYMAYFDVLFQKRNKKTELELEIANIPFTVREYNLFLLSGAGIGFLVGSLLFPLGALWSGIFGFISSLALKDLVARLFLGLVLGFAGSYAPKLYVKLLVNKKRKTLDSQIQDALLNLADALGAGFVISDAIRVVGEDLPSPMGDEFHKTHKEMDAGKTLHEALNSLKDRVNLQDLDIAINAIIIQDELGGKLEDLMRSIVKVIIERQELKKEIEKTIANSKMVGVILMVAPIFFCIVFFMMNKEQQSLLYNNKLGIIISLSAVLAYGIAVYIIMKIISSASSDL